MKGIILATLFFFKSIALFAQNPSHAKPEIDSAVFGKWPVVGFNASFSPDGHYCSYSFLRQSSVVLKSTYSDWKLELGNINFLYFMNDGLHATFIRKDTLFTVKLGGSTITFTPGVRSYKVVESNGSELWLLSLVGKKNELIIRRSGNESRYAGVKEYVLSDDHLSIILNRSDSLGYHQLERVDLAVDRSEIFWKDKKPADRLILDASGRQVAFWCEKSIYYYKLGMSQVILLANPLTPGIDTDLELDPGNTWSFSGDGQGLFLSLKKKARLNVSKDAVQVDVWSYTDPILQSAQLLDAAKLHSYPAYLAVTGQSRVNRLQMEGDTFIELSNWNGRPGNIAFVGHWYSERKWNKSALAKYVENVVNGSRVPVSAISLGQKSFSPKGKYFVSLDSSNRNLISYEIATGKRYNLTKKLPIPFDNDWDYPGSKPRVFAIASWLQADSAMLVYDRYDIWLMDPRGKRAAVNLTHGFGRKHRTSFGIVDEDNDPNCLIKLKKSVLLCAFDEVNKNNGFYRLKIGKQEDPEKLIMERYSYFFGEHPNYHILPNSFKPIKARDTTLWIVRRENAERAPNLYITGDFKKFKAVTAVYPEQQYNWLYTELFSYRSLSGEKLQGIIYKPENFNPRKKYPVIINYYEQMSRNLHDYGRHLPEPMYDNINIPWFVSRGYIVVTPDIHYPTINTGKNAFNCIMGATHFICKFSWVDKKHIGIQGHSFGGFETNYLVTHSHFFAAAMSSSGFANLLSSYGAVTLNDGNSFFEDWSEIGQGRFGVPPWGATDLYMENSPLLDAFKVTTPLLMMNNKSDGIVNFQQGIEFFIALRRLGKRAWMLQYDGQPHSIIDEHVAIQHTIRVTQFFDHYLKGAPTPKWMVEGIPAKMKGIDDGLELEPPGVEPGPGLLTPAEQKKVDALKHRKPITIKL
jgi:dienelactone hydrolase